MKNIFAQIADGYRNLFDFREYDRTDAVLKALIIPFATIAFTILLIACCVLYLFERLMAPFFKLFVLLVLLMMRSRFRGGVWRKRLYTLLITLVSIVFAPVVVLYFGCMLVKALFKNWMKSLVLRLDYAARFLRQELRMFDDKAIGASEGLGSAFKDLRKTSAVGGMIEAYLNKGDTESTEAVREKEADDDESVSKPNDRSA